MVSALDDRPDWSNGDRGKLVSITQSLVNCAFNSSNCPMVGVFFSSRTASDRENVTRRAVID